MTFKKSEDVAGMIGPTRISILVPAANTRLHVRRIRVSSPVIDQVMNTTQDCDEIEGAFVSASCYYARYCHMRDINVMGFINGIEWTLTRIDFFFIY